MDREDELGHGDMHALSDAALLKHTEDRRVVLPCDAVRVDFTIGKAV